MFQLYMAFFLYVIVQRRLSIKYRNLEYRKYSIKYTDGSPIRRTENIILIKMFVAWLVVVLASIRLVCNDLSSFDNIYGMLILLVAFGYTHFQIGIGIVLIYVDSCSSEEHKRSEVMVLGVMILVTGLVFYFAHTVRLYLL